MATVKQKYLKDENGEVFSPIVSASSVMTDRGFSNSSIEEIIPYTYKVNLVGNNFTFLEIFSGNIPNWTLIKIYLTVKTASLSKSKDINLRFNDQDISSEYAIDARCRDDAWSKYNPVTLSANLYIGDVAYSGNSSYFEVTVINGGDINGGDWWHSYKSFVGNATRTEGEYSISSCSGQFKHTNLAQELTSLHLSLSQGMQAKGIIQVYT